MIVFPLIRSVGLKAATASSRAATLPMFVRSRPFRASRPFPQPYPSPQSPSSVTSLCRVLACKAPLDPLSLDGLSDRNGSIKILASPASMRNAKWPCHVCFIGIVSSRIEAKRSVKLPVSNIVSTATRKHSEFTFDLLLEGSLGQRHDNSPQAWESDCGT